MHSLGQCCLTPHTHVAYSVVGLCWLCCNISNAKSSGMRLRTTFLKMHFPNTWVTITCVPHLYWAGISIAIDSGNSIFNKSLKWFLACMLSLFGHVKLFVTLWTVACQAPLSMGILQARILEWVAMPFSRGSSWPRDKTCGSCGSSIAGRFFSTEPLGKPSDYA